MQHDSHAISPDLDLRPTDRRKYKEKNPAKTTARFFLLYFLAESILLDLACNIDNRFIFIGQIDGLVIDAFEIDRFQIDFAQG